MLTWANAQDVNDSQQILSQISLWKVERGIESKFENVSLWIYEKVVLQGKRVLDECFPVLYIKTY